MRVYSRTSGCSFTCGKLPPPRSSLVVLSGQPLEELPAPALRSLELVEGVDVNPADPGGGVRERRAEPVEQLGRREHARPQQATDPAAVSAQEAGRLAQTDLERDPQQPAVVDR